MDITYIMPTQKMKRKIPTQRGGDFGRPADMRFLSVHAGGLCLCNRVKFSYTLSQKRGVTQ